MTLDTNIYVLDEVDHREVFAQCQRLLATYDDRKRPVSAQLSSDEQQRAWRNGKGHADPTEPWSIRNKADQGLPALLEITYRPGAPLRTAEDEAAHDPTICTLPDSSWYHGDTADLCDGQHAYRMACWLQVSFDTAYSAVSKGLRCSELHVCLIVGLGRWLDERHLGWKWMNEYSGQIYERYDGLASLIGDGDQAMAWFDREVVPALPAIVAQREDGSRS